MFLNSRIVAVILALVIAGITSVFLYFIQDIRPVVLIMTGIITFISSYLFIFFTLQYFFFNEIKKIIQLLDQIRENQFDFVKKNDRPGRNLLKRLNREIYTYAQVKQIEIENLKKMETYRKEFFADVSHELKTPLFAAQGFVHTLLDGAVKDKNVRNKFLKKAAKSLAGLDKMVQDLLTISQMEAGTIKMHFTDFNLYNLVEETFDQFENKAEKKELKLCFSETSPKHIMVHADRERMAQVMTNLISNGIIYSNSKWGKVMVNIIPDKDQVIIEVIDDGMGIPQEDLNRIFERFYRVDKSRSKDKGGSGLGLAIVKHILEAHKQKVSVSSIVGKGSTFRFSLPVAQ